MADIYSVVDLSRKKKNRLDQEEEQEYSVLEQRYFAPEADQSQPHTFTLDSPATTACAPAETGSGTAQSKEGKKSQISSKPTSYVVALIIASAAIVLVVVTCLAAVLFVEVNKLKSGRAPNIQQQVLLNGSSESQSSQLAEQLSLLTTNFSTFKDSIQTQLDEHLELIMSNSVESLFNESERLSLVLNTSLATFNNRIELLEMSQADVITASSCSSLDPSSPSGYYWVRASPSSAVRVYCDMSRSCGGVTGGWMRVAELNMTNSNQCPSGLKQRTDSTIPTCVSSSSSAGCSSDIIFETYGISYSRVCGQVIAYQIGHTNAFASQNEHVNEAYVDGVSLTHGNPRQHIWTFAAARDAHSSGSLDSKCPCITNGRSQPPQFVGEDYFCDTAGISGSIVNGHFFRNQPLWDGEGCMGLTTCCSFNNPPWFHKQLPQPTTDNVEMRVCRNEAQAHEDVAIKAVNIYVHL